MTPAETVTAADLAQATGVVKTTTLRRAEKEEWPYKESKNRARLYYIDSLPEDVRVALLTHQQEMPAVKEANPVFVGSAELTDQQNRIALARADLIRAYLSEKEHAKAKGLGKTEAARLFIKGYSTGHLLPRVFEVIGSTSFQNVEKWVRDFRNANYDYTALAPRWGNRAGQSKVLDHEFNTALSFMLHPNRLRFSEAIRLTKMVLKRRGLLSPSHDDTIRRSLVAWKKRNFDQWVFCREGEKALNDKVLPYIERDPGLLDVGEVLVADGHTLNFEILHPFTGKRARMTMVMWYDWASEMPVGWEIMPTENIQCVAAGLRRAILTLGKMPKVAYLDNGRAFKAKIFTDKDIDFEEAGFYGMFARLGIETLFAIPYNAQSKVVERFFGTFNELERLMPTYSGDSIKDKPARMLRNEKLHRRIYEKRYGNWAPTIEEANRIIAGWVTEYAQRPHRGLKGLCPIEVFKSGKGPGVDEAALRYLMMSMEPKGVPGRNGIPFMGRHYYDEALYGYRDRVMIRYDMEDLSRILVYDRTGSKLLCEAEPVKKVHPIARISGTKDDLEALKEASRRNGSLKKDTVSGARAYLADAPELIALPERPSIDSAAPSAGKSKKPKVLPRGEAERIEAEAAKMKVLELHPKEETVYASEADRYEALLEMECMGHEPALDDMQFMRYFEKTDIYKSLRERFEFLQESWLMEAQGSETK